MHAQQTEGLFAVAAVFVQRVATIFTGVVAETATLSTEVSKIIRKQNFQSSVGKREK